MSVNAQSRSSDLDFSKPPNLIHSFTFHVSLDPIQHIGTIPTGYRRFFPISGGTITGSRLSGRILPGGGDWNLITPDGVTHMFAKYTIGLPGDDSTETLVIVTNEGISRPLTQDAKQDSHIANQTSDSGQSVEASGAHTVQKYIRTSPKFEVSTGSKYEFLARSVWLGVMRPFERKDEVVIDFFEVC